MKGCSDVYQCCTILPNFYNVIVISFFFFFNLGMNRSCLTRLWFEWFDCDNCLIYKSIWIFFSAFKWLQCIRRTSFREFYCLRAALRLDHLSISQVTVALGSENRRSVDVLLIFMSLLLGIIYLYIFSSWQEMHIQKLACP